MQITLTTGQEIETIDIRPDDIEYKEQRSVQRCGFIGQPLETTDTKVLLIHMKDRRIISVEGEGVDTDKQRLEAAGFTIYEHRIGGTGRG